MKRGQDLATEIALQLHKSRYHCSARHWTLVVPRGGRRAEMPAFPEQAPSRLQTLARGHLVWSWDPILKAGSDQVRTAQGCPSLPGAAARSVCGESPGSRTEGVARNPCSADRPGPLPEPPTCTSNGHTASPRGCHSHASLTWPNPALSALLSLSCDGTAILPVAQTLSFEVSRLLTGSHAPYLVHEQICWPPC